VSRATWPPSLEVLREACAATGDRIESIDPGTNFLAKVTRGERSYVADAGLGTVYPLNAHFAAELARDKAHTADVLNAAGVPAIEGARFYTQAADAGRYAEGRTPADAVAHAEAQGYPLFAKLNRGAHGRLARRIGTPNELIAYLREARAFDHMILLQPLVTAPEARVFVLDGRARFLYRRERLTLVGDGRRTIAEILADHLRDPRLADEPTGLDAAAATLARLSRDRRALGDVPGLGEPVYAADAANLARGGRLADLDLAPSQAVHAWASRAARASGLRIFGADVFFERLDDPASYRVIELNANPSLTGLWRAGERVAALAIWKDVLEGYFADPR
jgi:cyanophycin synthetase